MDVVQFALIGLGTGGLYALIAQGIVLAHRASGTLNFAQGAFAMASAYVFYKLRDEANVGWPLALAGSILAGALLGVATAMIVLRPLRRRPPIVRLIATIGILLVVSSVFALAYGNGINVVASPLPNGPLHIGGRVSIGLDRVLIFIVAVALTAALTVIYRFTQFGAETAAVAENEQAAATMGISADKIDAINWAAAGGIGALAGILISPIAGLQVDALVFLILPGLAAALVANFSSFPLALAASGGIGIAEAEVTRFFPGIGGGSTVAFVVIIAILILRGKSLPGRNDPSPRLGPLGDGQVLIAGLIPAALGCGLLIFILPVSWIDPLVVSLVFSIILMSYVLVTGYAGQVSLAQYALAGMGAWFAGKVVADSHFGLELGIPIGIACTVPIGVLVGAPALRSRGTNLAIATLGLASIISALVLLNGRLTGGINGTDVGEARLFGYNVDAFEHPQRYALVALVSLVVVALAVANVRRGVAGRRLIAVRGNERAAASLGVNVVGAKLFAFGMASGIAALGGILAGFRNTIIVFDQFSVSASLTSLADTVIGGVGHLLGPLLGSGFAPSGLGTRPVQSLHSVDHWITVFGGGILILMLIFHPSGIADSPIVRVPSTGFRAVARRLRLVRGVRTRPFLTEPGGSEGPVTASVVPRRLSVRDLSVRYGGVLAVDKVSITVEPGQIIGLIGPNGAGKTSLVDAVTGFASVASGRVLIDGTSLDGLSPVRRSRLGLGRSFQSMELFDDLSVLDNLRVASDPSAFRRYLTDVVYPRKVGLTPGAIAAVDHFGIGKILDKRPAELSFATRRLVAIARSVAADPSILLLDEPAAGLDDREVGELCELIVSLARDRMMGILLIEHHVDMVLKACDHVVVIDFGICIAQGEPDAIRRNPEVVRAYLGGVEPQAGGQSTALEHVNRLNGSLR